jgi:virginiamycin B lyase
VIPGGSPRAYAVYVDETDRVWVTDFDENALLRFEPESGAFRTFPLPSAAARIRQLPDRKGQVRGAESGVDRLAVIRSR